MKLFENFNYLPYLGYSKKKFKNEHTEDLIVFGFSET